MRACRASLAVAIAMAPAVAAADLATAAGRARSGAFDATGEITCAQEVGEKPGSCQAAVSRADRAAVVVVRFPNGFVRMLSFETGEFLRGNATMSGVGTDTEWRLADGIYHVRVEDQRFELPEALVFAD